MFNTSVFWTEQDKVTVFHGTSAEKARRIQMEGLKVSESGHTKGKAFFTTSPKQACLYAAIGGEVEHEGHATIPPEERVVVKFSIAPSKLVPTSVWLKERWRFEAVHALMQDEPDFDPMGELYTKVWTPPECVVSVTYCHPE